MASFAFDDTMCVICRAPLNSTADSDISEVGRGLQRLIEYSEKRGDIELNSYLLTKPQVVKDTESAQQLQTRFYQQT